MRFEFSSLQGAQMITFRQSAAAAGVVAERERLRGPGKQDGTG
jgi:hypothetical protein